MSRLLKKTIIVPKRLGTYFYGKGHAIVTDYIAVSKDVTLSAKKRPLLWTGRITFYSSLLYAYINRPTFESYQKIVFDKKFEMLEIGVNRSKRANDYLQNLARLDNKNLLIAESFILFTIIREIKFSKTCCSPDAVFDRLSGRWWNPLTYYYASGRFLSSISDVGIAGKFLKLEYELGGSPDSDEQILIDNGLIEVYKKENTNAGNFIAVLRRSLDVGKRNLGIQTVPLVPPSEQRTLELTFEDY